MDGDISVSAVVTSASVPDCPVAIPLAQMTAQRVTWLYGMCRSLIGTRAAGKSFPSLRREQRFQERSASERSNSLLKERSGGRWVRVRGAGKVMCPVMFGLVALS